MRQLALSGLRDQNRHVYPHFLVRHSSQLWISWTTLPDTHSMFGLVGVPADGRQLHSLPPLSHCGSRCKGGFQIPSFASDGLHLPENGLDCFSGVSANSKAPPRQSLSVFRGRELDLQAGNKLNSFEWNLIVSKVNSFCHLHDAQILMNTLHTIMRSKPAGPLIFCLNREFPRLERGSLNTLSNPLYTGCLKRLFCMF